MKVFRALDHSCECQLVTNVYLLKDSILSLSDMGGGPYYTTAHDDGHTLVNNEPARLFTQENGSNTVALQEQMITGPHGGGYAEVLLQGRRRSVSCREED